VVGRRDCEVKSANSPNDAGLIAALLIEKQAEAAERARIKALARQAQADSEASTGDADLWC
jgi:hypothetical protein